MEHNFLKCKWRNQTNFWFFGATFQTPMSWTEVFGGINTLLGLLIGVADEVSQAAAQKDVDV